MSDGKIYDIHSRIYKWVIEVIKYCNKLRKTTSNLILIRQLIKSSTSVGANDQEANAADSSKDFISKYVISRKECKESIFWLNVIRDTNSTEFENEANKLISEGKEISNIISSIIKKTKLHN